jgi:hypothetical protein
MPLATMRTNASSGRGSVNSSCSMANAPDFSRTTAAVICMMEFAGWGYERRGNARQEERREIIRKLPLTPLICRMDLPVGIPCSAV